jgi:hypothetical protein
LLLSLGQRRSDLGGRVIGHRRSDLAVVLFGAGYTVLAADTESIVVLAVPFVAAG